MSALIFVIRLYIIQTTNISITNSIISLHRIASANSVEICSLNPSIFSKIIISGRDIFILTSFLFHQHLLYMAFNHRIFEISFYIIIIYGYPKFPLLIYFCPWAIFIMAYCYQLTICIISEFIPSGI